MYLYVASDHRMAGSHYAINIKILSIKSPMMSRDMAFATFPLYDGPYVSNLFSVFRPYFDFIWL